MRDAEVVHCEHRDAGKRFVYFEQIDIADRPPGFGQAFGDCANRSGGESRWFLRVRGMGDDAGDGLMTLGIGDRLPGENQSCRTVGNRRTGRRRNRAVLCEGRAKAGDLVGHALAGLLVGIDHNIALAGRNGHRDDLVLERAIGNRGLRATERFNRVIVLRSAG